MFARLITALFKDRDGYVGRKLAAAWALTILISLLLVVHLPLGLITGTAAEAVLHSSDFTTVISLIWATYFASDSINHWTYTTQSKKSDDGRGE